MGDRPRNNYRKARNQDERGQNPGNEVRVGAKSAPGEVISRIAKLIHPESDEKNAEKRVTVTAIDKAIPKAILAAEMIRSFIAGVHQITELKKTQISEVYEPTV